MPYPILNLMYKKIPNSQQKAMKQWPNKLPKSHEKQENTMEGDDGSTPLSPLLGISWNSVSNISSCSIFKYALYSSTWVRPLTFIIFAHDALASALEWNLCANCLMVFTRSDVAATKFSQQKNKLPWLW